MQKIEPSDPTAVGFWGERDVPMYKRCSKCGDYGMLFAPVDLPDRNGVPGSRSACIEALQALWKDGCVLFDAEEPLYFAPLRDWPTNDWYAFTGDLCCWCWNHQSEHRGAQFNECRRQAQIAAGITPKAEPITRFASASISDFDRDIQARLLDWLHKPGKWALLISGNRNSGKTHAAEAIRRHCRSWPDGTKFWYTPDFSDFLDTKVWQDETVRALAEFPGVLIFDDLGRERLTDKLTDALRRIFNTRYSGNLRTVITSELKPSQIQARYQDHFRLARDAEGLVLPPR